MMHNTTHASIRNRIATSLTGFSRTQSNSSSGKNVSLLQLKIPYYLRKKFKLGKLSQKTCDFHFINSFRKAAAWLTATALYTFI